MDLNCLNTIITDNLAIHIDITQLKSWNLNSGLTLVSLTKWNNAISDDLELFDFGLTAFDNGRVDNMTDSLLLNQNDNKMMLFRVGYNDVVSGGTYYSGYTINPITGSSVGRYFNLDGGYLQGFFKLNDYNYELLSPRYNNGITIETIIELLPQTEGIFYYMGTRSEDKYNMFFSGECTIIGETKIKYSGNNNGYDYDFSGVTTSENHFLNSYYDKTVKLNAFKRPEYSDVTISDSISQLENISNNIIAFGINSDKRLYYTYVNNNGSLIQNESPSQINRIGWTIIDVVFKPYEVIEKYDKLKYNCYPRRKGDLIFYINGRKFWKITDFDEFYFKPINNDKEKQLGVPFNISWGGGSFGLKHSWHYDLNTYTLYNTGDTYYINTNFNVENDPIPTNCEIDLSDISLSGLSLSADSSTFKIIDICNSQIENPFTVMRVEYTGGTSANTYFIKYVQPITILSNRDYEINLSLFNNNFFKTLDENGNRVENKVSILAYGTTDINIINDIEYEYPLISSSSLLYTSGNTYPYPDRQEYQYIRNNIMYYGVSGLPVIDGNEFLSYGRINSNTNQSVVTGINSWKPLKSVFRIDDNIGEQIIYIGILIETTDTFNLNNPLFITNFTYTGADKLAKDETKDNLFVEKYFDSSFIGNIQKLRVYDIAFEANQVLHNAIIEAKNNTAYNILISKGGRLIHQYENLPYIPQQTSGSDIRKSIRYRNSDGTYKDLYQMIDIKVVVKSRSNPTIELVKFKKIAETGWLQLLWVNDTTYDFIVPDTITSLHPNEILFAEIKFQWADPLDIDNVYDKIFVIDITSSNLLNNTVKNY